MGYITAGKLYIREVFNCTSSRLSFCGLTIRISQKRLSVFKKSLCCVKCGLRGNFFLIQKSGAWDWHINLWHISDNGFKRLMTIDHKLPRAKGGTDDVDNLQTMCSKCNHNKGDKLEEEPSCPAITQNI